MIMLRRSMGTIVSGIIIGAVVAIFSEVLRHIPLITVAIKKSRS